MSSGLASDRWLACGVIAAGGAGVVLALAAIVTPLHGLLVLVFLVAAPTAIAASWLRSLDIIARIVVACTAAIILNAAVAETMLAAGAWSPRLGLVAIALICAVGSAFALRPARDALIARR